MLAPCFWQARIQAGDLLSHVYNVWLLRLVQAGEISGLRVTFQWTNVLFDRLLSGAVAVAGYRWGTKIAVAVAVLVFFWGAFCWIRQASGRSPWSLAPLIAMLTYGWVFHMGFFNFYLSLAICLWSLALAWNGSWKARACAVLLLVVASAGHTLPVLWAIATYAFSEAVRRLKPRFRLAVAVAALAGVIAARLVLEARLATVWYPVQAVFITGFDQLWVYGTAHVLLAVTAGALVISRLVRLGRAVVADVLLLMAILGGLAVALLPTRLTPSGMDTAVAFVAERMSLMVALLLTATAARAKPARWESAALGAVTVIWFGFVFAGASQLNRLEDRLETALEVRGTPRVIAPWRMEGSRVNGALHLIDRACIGRCFSFGNYEPPSGYFRLRTTGPNPYVTADGPASRQMQYGGYRVRESDPPLYLVRPAGPAASRFELVPLKPGDTVELIRLDPPLR